MTIRFTIMVDDKKALNSSNKKLGFIKFFCHIHCDQRKRLIIE